MAQKPIKYEVLVVGGSAGSLEAILQFLPALKNEKKIAIILVVHRRSGESLLTGLLQDKSDWRVKEAEEKEPVEPGVMYIAPADYHLLIENDRTFSLDYSEKVHFSRPSIDVTFEAAADVYGPAVIAILLSGANQDGTEGLQKIKAAGGFVIVQDPSRAVASFMPRYAVEHLAVDRIVPVQEIPSLIHSLV